MEALSKTLDGDPRAGLFHNGSAPTDAAAKAADAAAKGADAAAKGADDDS